MTSLRSALTEATAALTAAEVPSPRADALALVGHVLGADRGEVERRLVLGGELDDAAAERLRRLVEERATRVPLIRDETGSVIVGAAVWVGADSALIGEAVVDDTVLFDGEVAGVRVEPEVYCRKHTSLEVSRSSVTVARDPSHPMSPPPNVRRQPRSHPVPDIGECGARSAICSGCMLDP